MLPKVSSKDKEAKSLRIYQGYASEDITTKMHYGYFSLSG